MGCRFKCGAARLRSAVSELADSLRLAPQDREAANGFLWPQASGGHDDPGSSIACTCLCTIGQVRPGAVAARADFAVKELSLASPRVAAPEPECELHKLGASLQPQAAGAYCSGGELRATASRAAVALQFVPRRKRSLSVTSPRLVLGLAPSKPSQVM